MNSLAHQLHYVTYNNNPSPLARINGTQNAPSHARSRVGTMAMRQPTSAATKYPAPGDIYSSRLDPDDICKVISNINGHVTYHWLNEESRMDVQSTPIKLFVRYFRLRMYPVE